MSSSAPHSPVSGAATVPYAGLQHGFVLADKPPGLGSAGLVGRLKQELSRQQFPVRGRGLRVGHTGTLDRFASGLMVLLVGKGTALADQFLHADKAYLARFSFGRFTDTHDPEGAVVSERDLAAARELVRSGRKRIVQSLQEICDRGRQRPPVYSALKQDGRRFSDRARAGEIRLPDERAITVYDLCLRDMDPEAATVDFEIQVSGGTYIRSLARDLSEALDFPLHLGALRRFRLGEQRIAAEWPGPAGADESRVWAPRFYAEPTDSGAVPVDSEEPGRSAASAAVIQDLRLALADWPRVAVPPEQTAAIQSGRTPELSGVPEESGLDFWLGLADTAEPSARPTDGSASGGLLAWARTVGGGSYRYQRVFV